MARRQRFEAAAARWLGITDDAARSWPPRCRRAISVMPDGVPSSRINARANGQLATSAEILCRRHILAAWTKAAFILPGFHFERADASAPFLIRQFILCILSRTRLAIESALQFTTTPALSLTPPLCIAT